MNIEKLKIGIIGCGTIGTEIALACRGRLKDKVILSAVCDANAKSAQALIDKTGLGIGMLGLDEIIKEAQFIVEAASASISSEVLKKCIGLKRDCLIMSVGGLIGGEGLLEEAKKKGIKVYIPSGALCGIDGLKSAMAGKIDSVTLTTRKPPKGLVGAPYLKEQKIDVENIKKETVVFEGSAQDAVKGFPQNVNVSAVLSLAGIGARKTTVRLVTSPDYTKNIHEVEVTGEFGRMSTITENVPSKTNPKTSALAIFSAIATLEAAVSSVRIGT